MPTPATLNLTWTSNYVLGCHRIGYRIQGSGDPYTIIDNIFGPNCPPGLGAACYYNVAISVENETCDSVTYEGYIQPCCEDILSLTGRIPWNITYNPVPSCIAVTFTCNNVGIFAATVGNNGGGTYTPGAGYTVNAADIIGGGGAGTTITFDVDGGGNITNPIVTVVGSGYTSAPTINITTLSGAGGDDSGTLIPEMDTCPIIGLGATCDSADAGISTKALLSSSFEVCYTGGTGSSPVPPANYTAVDNPATCCYDCVSLQIDAPASGAVAQSTYLDCTTGQIQTVNLAPLDPPVNVCAKRNSWVTGNSQTVFTPGPVCT